VDNQGWRIPTPHEVLGVLLITATAIRESGMFPETSPIVRICAIFAMSCALAGISAARLYHSPRVRAILDQHDPYQPKDEVKKP
jgi:hypothetical protein